MKTSILLYDPDLPSAGSILNALQAVFPLYGSSFYAKGRITRRDPPREPSSVTLDITRRCSFGCRFCFAAHTRSADDHTPLPLIESLLTQLTGLDKLVLIGGEPFEHPALKEILAKSRETATREVEIFTNGAALPADFESASRWLQSLWPTQAGSSSPVLTLTLALDRWHRERHGSQALSRCIRVLLALEEARICRFRVNLTDTRIQTRDYLDRPTLSAVFSDLAPELRPRFEAALAAGQVEEQFYLNPVITQGLQLSGPGIEYLRAADFQHHPETVFTVNRGRPLIVSALNAAWMRQPPDGLIIGDPSQISLNRLLLERLVYPRLHACDHPERQAAFLSLCHPVRDSGLEQRAAGSHENRTRTRNPNTIASLSAARRLADLRSILENPEAFFSGLANRVWALGKSSHPDDPSIELSGRIKADAWGLPLLQQLIRQQLEKGDESVFDTALRQTEILLSSATPRVPVFLSRPPTLSGGESGEIVPLPLSQTALDTALGPWPETASQLVHPRAIGSPQTGLSLDLPHVDLIEWDLSPDEAAAATRRLFLYWEALFHLCRPVWQRRLSELVTKLNPSPEKRLHLIPAESFNPQLPQPSQASLQALLEAPAALARLVLLDPARWRLVDDNPDLIRGALQILQPLADRQADVRNLCDELAYWARSFSNSNPPETVRP